ncbi:MAG: hypothetical protein HY716_10480 [Planctomycetes bacterium]|nr:hypothetical protein [Planctomycetota bacterium]
MKAGRRSVWMASASVLALVLGAWAITLSVSPSVPAKRIGSMVRQESRFSLEMLERDVQGCLPFAQAQRPSIESER